MIVLIIDITDYLIIYGTYFVLVVFIYLFIANFAGHFKFNYKCPIIIKDEEISGVYPTLLVFYLLISFIITLFIIYITRNDEYYFAHSTFNYSMCYMEFKIFSTG